LVFFTGSRGIYYRFRDRQVHGLYNLLRRQKSRGIIRADIDVRLLSERIGLFASAMCIEWSDRPFALGLLHQKLCSGIANMLSDSLSEQHLEPLIQWAASIHSGMVRHPEIRTPAARLGDLAAA